MTIVILIVKLQFVINTYIKPQKNQQSKESKTIAPQKQKKNNFYLIFLRFF